jgi:hypothetical protein
MYTAGDYQVDCTATVTGGLVPLQSLVVTSDAVTATCAATSLVATDTTCTFTRQYTAAQAAAGSSIIDVSATAAPDVTSSATITAVTADDSVTQTRTARLSIVHTDPGSTVTTVGEWNRQLVPA